MRAARIEITKELLLELFHFPEGTEIIGVKMADREFGAIELTVAHESLKEVERQIPFVRPQWTKHFAIPEKVVFDGWGQS